MRSLHRQGGVAGVLIAIIAILLVVGYLAFKLLSQISQTNDRNATLDADFRAIQAALVQYVAANGRLPCPANPATDDGDAAPATATAACTYPEGTVPWRTIGARRDDSIDPWSGKISYRVYTGAAGALTQDQGASMVECDLLPSGAGTTTDPIGKCQHSASYTQRDTSQATFLAGKGLGLTDMGAPQRTDVAYVLVSHGPSGLGAYTSSGVRREMPAGGSDELANTTATGPFLIKASTQGVDATAAAHFDDLLAYRGIEDLIRTAGLGARDWPEETSTNVAVTFDKPTVEAAVSHAVTPGTSIGTSTASFNGLNLSGFGTGGAATDLSYGESGVNGGAGIAGGGSAMLDSGPVGSGTGEKIRVDFTEKATRLGIVLNDFGAYGSGLYEVAELRFYSGGVELAAGSSPKYAVACHADGGLASFEITTASTWDRVEIKSFGAITLSPLALAGTSAFYVTQVVSCPSTQSTCLPSLSDASNFCGVFDPP